MKSKHPLTLIALAAILLIGAFAVTGCMQTSVQPSPTGSTPSPSPSVASASRLKVVTSFRPITLIVKAVVGNDADVTQILPIGASPHEYEPTPGDAKALVGAQLMVYDGPFLEPWAQSFATSVNPEIQLVTIADAIPKAQLDALHASRPDFPNFDQDPHLWLSPQLVESFVPHLEQKLETADPAHASDYAQNAPAFEARLKALDSDYQTGLANCSTRTFLTSHAFLDYMGAAYNLSAISIAGLSPDAEPSLQQMAAILNESKAAHVQGVLSEPDELQSLSQSVASEMNLTLYPFSTMEILSPTANSDDYVTIMESNLKQMRKALVCT